MTGSSLVEDTLNPFFEDRCPPLSVNALVASRALAPLWDEVEELGFTLISVPEASGGAGGETADAVSMLRSAGRNAVPLPLCETAMLAGWALSRAGLGVEPGMSTALPVHRDDVIRAEPAGGGLRLSGRASLVPWASYVERLVVLATDDEDRLWVCAVPASSVQITAGRNVAGEPRDDVVLDGVLVEEGPVARAPFDLETYFLRGALGRAASMLGALEKCRDLTVQYATVRQQFGKPLSQFQAVQQMMARLARDVALTRAAVQLATESLSDDDSSGWLQVAAAKILAGQAAGTVAAHAHQVHGAIGVTSEYPLSILTLRLWAWRNEHGSEEEWAAHIGARAARHPGGVWDFVTARPLSL